MLAFSFRRLRKKRSLAWQGASCCVKTVPKGQRGNVLFYIFIAIGLLGALTFAMTRQTGQNVNVQMGHRAAEDLYVQAASIRAAIVECIIQYPQGGDGPDNNNPDIDGDGDTDDTDNPNNPYPIEPNKAFNPHGVAANIQVRNVSCTAAPTTEANIFQGSNNRGRFLPPPPSGFGEWTYHNDTNGVRIQIIGTGGATVVDAITRLRSKFALCQAEVNFATCGATCITVWIMRKTAAACL